MIAQGVRARAVYYSVRMSGMLWYGTAVSITLSMDSTLCTIIHDGIMVHFVSSKVIEMAGRTFAPLVYPWAVISSSSRGTALELFASCELLPLTFTAVLLYSSRQHSHSAPLRSTYILHHEDDTISCSFNCIIKTQRASAHALATRKAKRDTPKHTDLARRDLSQNTTTPYAQLIPT